MDERWLLLHRILERVTKVLHPVLCRKLVMLPLFAELRREAPVNVIGPRSSAALALLQNHCRLCGRCWMARG